MNVMDWGILFPEALLILGAMVALLGDVIWPRAGRFWLLWGAVILLGGILTATQAWALGQAGPFLDVDGTSQFLRVFLLMGVLLVFGLSEDPRSFSSITMPWGTYAGLILLATSGLLLLLSSSDFVMVALSLEIAGVASFVLAGFLKHNRVSNEAAIKFFLLGAFATGLLLFGVAWLYGLSGGTSFESLRQAVASAPRLPLVLASLFILAGFGFKLALVPFHMWVPDTYQGAPTPVTAFLSVAPKTAAFGALLKALSVQGDLGLTALVVVLSGLTMTLGNVAALKQTNIKRLLGYSSIAQMGTALVGFAVGGSAGWAAVLFYLAVYGFSNLGAFAIALAVINDAGREDLDAFIGLSKRSMPLALLLTVFLLSLTGLPPLAGFLGKFALFGAAVSRGWVILAVVALVNGVVSLYYYAGLLHRVFFKTNPESVKPPQPRIGWWTVAWVSGVVTLGVGIFPNLLWSWAQGVAR